MTRIEKKSNLLDFFHVPEPRSKKNQEKEGLCVKKPQKISLTDEVVLTTHTQEISFEDFLKSRPDG